MSWSNGFCSERGKRGGMVGKGRGPWHRNVVIIFFNEFFWGRLSIQVFPLDKAHKVHFQHLYDVMNLEKRVCPLCA
jgi:hypothetical protein